MVYKHHMPLFSDIHGFEGLPTFPPEIATFRNGTLTIFPKCSRKSQTLMWTVVWKSIQCWFPGFARGPTFFFTFFLIQKSVLSFQPKKMQLNILFLTAKVYFLLPKIRNFKKRHIWHESTNLTSICFLKVKKCCF